MPVAAGAIAAKEQLLRMTLQKAGGKRRIACECVITRVGREGTKQVGIVREPLVRDASANDGRSWIILVIRIVGAYIRPECIAVPDERGLRKLFQDLIAAF